MGTDILKMSTLTRPVFPLYGLSFFFFFSVRILGKPKLAGRREESLWPCILAAGKGKPLYNIAKSFCNRILVCVFASLDWDAKIGVCGIRGSFLRQVVLEASFFLVLGNRLAVRLGLGLNPMAF